MTPNKARELAREWMNQLRSEYINLSGLRRTGVEYNDANIDSLSALIERVSLETKVWAFELIEGKSLTDSVMIYAQEFSKAKDRLATLNARGGDDE